MDLSQLPPEYAEQIQKLQRQQQIAQFLQQQAMQANTQPTQVLGGYAVKRSPLEGIASLLTGVLGTKAGSDAGTGITQVQGQAQKAQQEEISNLVSQYQADPKAGIAAALAAKFPGNRKLGEDWQKQYQERVNQFAGVAKDTDPRTAGAAVAGQQIPSNWAPPPLPSPSFATDPAGNPYVQTANRKGETEVKYAPKGVNVTTNLASREGEMAFARESKDLETRQQQARDAMQELANAQRLNQVLEQGAQVGGGAGIKQATRKFFQAFGVDTPETGPTDAAKQLLGEKILDRAKTLGANPSNADRDAIKEIVGSIDTDPTALSRLLSYTTASALKSVQDFQNFLQVKQEKATPGIDYTSAGVGIRLPENLFGSQNLQMNTIQALQQLGGDITRFKDPSGQPFVQGSQFNIPPTAVQPRNLSQPQTNPNQPISLDDYLKRIR